MIQPREQTGPAGELQRNETRSRFIAAASHEFRTPLSTILTATQLLEQYDASLAPQKRIELLRRIQAAAHQMTALLEGILTIGRISVCELHFEPERLNLPAFCTQLIEEVEGAESKRHRIDLDIDTEVRTVLLDPQVLRHILKNLLANALKFSPVDTQVNLAVVLYDGLVVFKIVDCGSGIPADELPHVFEPFFQGRVGCRTPGSGLGLTIVQESVQLLGGALRLESTVGVGTTVIVSIPVR